MTHFDIRICGLDRSLELRDTWATHVVSLIDRGYPTVFPPMGDHHLVLRVDDVEADHGTLVAPTAADLTAVLAFTAGLTDGDRLLIHCHAGVSRSTAAALAVCVQHGATPEDAIGRIHGLRDCMYPNQTLVRLTDAHFGLNGSLTALVTTWKQEQGSQLIRFAIEKTTGDDIAEMKRLLELMK